MAFVDRTKLLGFCLEVDQAEDHRLAAILDAKIGQKGNLNSFEQQGFLDEDGVVDFV